MLRLLGALVAGATIGAVGLTAARAQDTKKGEKAEIPGGIEGTIKGVDKEKGTVGVVLADGKTRTFTVTEDTTIVGARGGKVRRRLNDRRFRDGLDITVVATGTTAKELHLGIYRRDPSEPEEKPKAVAKKKMTRKEREELETEVAKAPVKKMVPKAAEATAKSAAEEEEDDEDDEVLGKVKSYNTGGGRHLLVVTLLNGKGRTFFLAKDVKVLVKGKESKEGLMDPAIKEGAAITVLTDAGGRRVKELHLQVPSAASSKTKKAA